MSRPAPRFSIRDVVIDPCTVLAPMEGVTDAPFRAMIRAMGGCGLVVTEFVSAHELSRQTRRAVQAAHIAHDTHPVSIQIYGRDPALMADSARLCEELGADIIDINMGCPSKAVTSGCAGVALMREPGLAREIVRQVRAAVRVPLTVKMRLGWDHRSRNAPDLARMCQEEGAEAIAVHGRTKADLYSGHADWEAIGQVKDAVRIPVIGNGDIRSVADALECFRLSGVDGVMAGRGTLRNPWLLLQIGQALRGGPVYEPTLAERRRHLLDYYALICRQLDRPIAQLGKMKKVTGHFTTGVPYADELRQEVFHSESVLEAIDAVNRFFDRMEALAERGIEVFRLGPAAPARLSA
jgi:tRNA-dihydrouridine synthase B